jgi:amino acid adenylation domain-containing protein
MNPDRRTAWIIRGYLLDGVIDTDRLAETLTHMKARHWYLCCSIGSDGKMQPQDAVIPVEIAETTDDPWIVAQRYVQTQFEPFHLEQGKLFRLHVFQGTEQSAVIIAIHHILADHDGVDVLSRELDSLFAGDDTGLLPVTNLVAAYQQQRSKLAAKLPVLQDFWRDCLEDLPAVTPLPQARAKPEPACRNGALIRHEVNPELVSRCRAAASTAGVSPFQWFLAAWVVLLARYYNRDDVHLGTLLSTRNSAQQNALGSFQNLLLLRTQLEKAETFAEVLAAVRSTLGKAIAHGNLPIDESARLISGRQVGAPLFSTAFTMVTTKQTKEFFGHKVVRMEELDYAGTALDLTFFVIAAESQLSFAMEFDTAIYDRESLSTVFDQYEILLTQLVADVDSDWRQCRLMSVDDLENLRAEWQQIAASPPPAGHLEDAFYEHAHKTPDAIALRWDGDNGVKQIGYGELAARANAVAGFIESVADPTDTIVAIIGSWRPDIVAALVGTVHSGRAYLPIDMNYPAERIEHILNDAGRPLLIKQQGVQTPPGYADRCYSLDEAVNSTIVRGTPTCDSAIAYLIYTSGSSGAPKGVRVSHSSALYSTAERCRVYADWLPENFLLLSSFAFDSAVAGLWWSLSCGACLRLVDREAVRAADSIAEIIIREDITHTLCLPGQWSDICRVSTQPLDSMRLVIVAGEACRSATADHHFERAAGAALYNEYGPTEMTVWSTYCRLGPDSSDPIPIGQALAKTQALVVDDCGTPLPHGLSGELVLSGHGIAEGYSGHAQGGFIPHPLDPSRRAYRTGDIAKVGSDGLIRFLGRTDQQVKYRGYRIGIEAIEQALSTAGTEVALIPWDGTSLEDILAELPEHEAHALVDKYLSRDDAQTAGR